MARLLLVMAITSALLRPAHAEEPPAAVAPVPAAAPSPIVAESEPAPRPLRKRPMLWVALFGGVAVLAAGVTLAFVLGSAPRDPQPTLGVAYGN